MTSQVNDAHVGLELPAYINGSLDPSSADRVREHLATCLPCRNELAGWQAIAGATAWDAAEAARPAAGVLDRVLVRIERSGAEATSRPQPERMFRALWGQPRRLLAPLVGAAAALVLIGAIALTPIGSYAQGFLTIFTPKQFAAVAIAPGDLSTLLDLRDYGTITGITKPKPVRLDGAAAASEQSGMTLRAPASLPPGVQNTPMYAMVPSQTVAFTFDAEKARAAAAAKGKELPPMPANIDGSSLQITTDAAVLTIYPATAGSQPEAAARASEPRPSTEGEPAGLGLPALAVGQTKTPIFQATGASVPEVEAFLLAQPGISPKLAQAIRDLADPTAILPIPIPLNKAASHPVQVQGVDGLAVADSTGIAGGIIWEKDGMIYGVGGTFSESVLLEVANSLR